MTDSEVRILKLCRITQGWVADIVLDLHKSLHENDSSSVHNLVNEGLLVYDSNLCAVKITPSGLAKLDGIEGEHNA
jgi:hypothetical protein